MKKFLWTFVLACLALMSFSPTAALAQLECAQPNTFALVFDNGDINITTAPFTQFNMHIVVLNPTETMIGGIEFRIEEPANFIVVSRFYPGSIIDVGLTPDHVIGYGVPQPVIDGQFTVGTWGILSVDINEAYLNVEPVWPASAPGQISYVAPNSSILIPMVPFSGSFTEPLVSINGETLTYCTAPPLERSVTLSFDNDFDNVAGSTAGALDGYDPSFDEIDFNLALTFPHPEWARPEGQNFRHDVKDTFDPTVEVRQWTFVASADADLPQSGEVGGRTVNLNVSPSFGFSPDYDFTLFDRMTGITYNLFDQTSIDFYLPGGTTFAHTFDMFIGREFNPDPTLWVDVAASANGFSEPTNRLATATDATDGYDGGLDIPEPANPPANYVSSSFIHTDWPLGPRFQTDVRAIYDPTTDTKTWPLRVETDQSGIISLAFGASFTDQDNIGLQLRDLQSNQTFHLFPQMNYAFESTGLGVYNFEIIVGVSGPPELNPTSRDLPAGWSLVGFPLRTLDRTLDEVIWGQAPGYAYMFAHNPGAGYTMAGHGDVSQQEDGYWIATDSAYTWTMSGTPNLNDVIIPLAPGWNLVGNPMWFPGPFEGMAIIHNGARIPWTTAIAQGLVATGVQSYDQRTDRYFDAIDLQPWQGYWIAAYQPNLQLVFNWNNFEVLPARLTVQKSGTAVNPLAWSTELTLQNEDHNKKIITLGINPDATNGFDAMLDMPLPPAPPSGGPVIAFTRPEWDLASGDYFSRDVIPPSGDDMHWNAIISLANPGQAKLTWDSSNWPDGTDFQIYLPTENRVIVMSMREQSEVKIALGAAAMPIVVRSPDMLSGSDDTPIFEYAVGVHPNPFNPTTTVNFALPKAGDVEIRLYSVRGELINTIGNAHYAAGRQSVIWQGTDRYGRNVPSGSYFAKLFVDGKAMGPVTKMSLVR